MTLGVGSAALLAGLGGMNVSRVPLLALLCAGADARRTLNPCPPAQLQNHFETHPNMFYFISSFAVALAVLSSLVGLRHLKKVMRIGLADSDIVAQRSYNWLDKVGRPAGAGLIGRSATEPPHVAATLHSVGPSPLAQAAAARASAAARMKSRL